MFDDKILESRLDRAVRHVSDYWIPINPALASRVQQGIAEGRYDQSIDDLIGELEQDLSLFALALGRLTQMMVEQGEELPKPFHPHEVFRRSGLERLRQILEHEVSRPTTHDFCEGSDLQVARFHEALVSAATTEALAESGALDSEACYAAALLRQLGYALIAWNYPAMYQEAVSGLKPGDRLDEVLSRELGFSPSLLAVRLFSIHGIPIESLAEAGIIDDEDSEFGGAAGPTIARLCKVGEALARAHHRGNYPSARDDWEFAKTEIEKRLGPKGMEIIRERILDNFEHYVDLVPHIFRPGLILDLGDEPPRDSDILGEYHNPYLSQCRPREQQAIRELYRRLTNDVLSGDNLRIFINETLPRTSFTGGLVYTVDPALLRLVPQLELGRLQMRKFEAIDYAIADSRLDIVAVAYQSSEPVVAYGTNANGDLVSTVAGLFGTSQRYGVLYLEILGLVSDDPVQLFHFRALQHALNDCLSL